MTNEEYDALAQRAVRQGLIERMSNDPLWFKLKGIPIGTAEQACKDGRVVLAAIKKAKAISCEAWVQLMKSLMHTYHDTEVGPAILDACLTALEEEE